MIENMTHVMIFVKNYDEALDFYTNKLGFVKVSDFVLAPEFRFLSVSQKAKVRKYFFMCPMPLCKAKPKQKGKPNL